MKNDIALFGGTFDPVHLGHLRSAQHVRSVLSLNEIRLVPSLESPHRKHPESTVEHRLAMLRLAALDFPGIVIDDREIARGGLSYSVDTLESFRNEFGLRIAIYLIMGMDAFNKFDEWYRWRDIGHLCNIIVLERPGNSSGFSSLMNRWIENSLCSLEQLQGRPGGKVCFVELEQMDISSTEIREALRRGLKPSLQLPTKVENYIQVHGLYQGGYVNA